MFNLISEVTQRKTKDIKFHIHPHNTSYSLGGKPLFILVYTLLGSALSSRSRGGVFFSPETSPLNLGESYHIPYLCPVLFGHVVNALAKWECDH